jgi:hypothetical protein
MKTREGVSASGQGRGKRLDYSDTLIIGFNNTTRDEVRSALASDPSVKTDPMKLPWAYYELTWTNNRRLCLLIPLTRNVTHAGCLHLYQLIEPDFGALLAPFVLEPCVMGESALSCLFQCLGESSRKLDPDFFFERDERARSKR